MSLLSELFKGEDIKVKGTIAYGTYKGYYVTAQMPDGTTGIRTRISYNRPEGGAYGIETKGKLQTLLSQLRETHDKLYSYQVDNYFVEFDIAPNCLKKKKVEITKEILNAIIQLLKSEGCTSGCQMCGSSDMVRAREVNGFPLYVCYNCNNDIVRNFENDKQSKRANKSHLIPGLVGAFLGTLVGVVVWVLIYQLGYISMVGGAVMIAAAMFGYEKLGGSLDTKGAFISFALSMVMIYVSNKLSWTMLAYRELSEYGVSFFDLYKNLMGLIDELDAMGDFIEDLAYGYLFSIIVGISMVWKALKNARGSYKIKDL